MPLRAGQIKLSNLPAMEENKRLLLIYVSTVLCAAFVPLNYSLPRTFLLALLLDFHLRNGKRAA